MSDIPALTPARLTLGIFQNLFTALAGSYGLSVLGFLLLRAAIGERWLAVALLNQGLHLLLLPALVLLPLALLLRRRVTALFILPAFLTALAVHAPFFLPNAEAPTDAPRLSLLTYNLHAEQNVLQPLVDVIREADADVVILQEMSMAASARFEVDLADVYPYFALHPVEQPNHGRGILSRYPITEDYAWRVEYPIPLRLQRAMLDVNGTPITLYNMHAPPSTPIWGQGYDPIPRREQLLDLMAMIAEESGPLLLAGDFNTTDLGESYGHITALMSDTFHEVGWGLGFTNPDWSHPQSAEGPTWIPTYQRIDYVFFNAAFQAVEARVWDTSGGSDHRPVYAVLTMKAPPA